MKNDKPHKSGPVKIVQGQRLAYYRTKADEKFWAGQWQDIITPEIYHSAEKGGLGTFEYPFTRYLPKKGRIIEAGCGMGQFVLGLNNRGYECEGVEWAKPVVEAVKKIHPDLPIRVGDVTCLDVADGHYSGYISLGVVEHREQGPEPFLAEAHRVLENSGIMLLTVPHFNALRRFKAAIGRYNKQPGDIEFYQYALHPREMTALLEKSGFEVMETWGYDSAKGIKDEIPRAKWIIQSEKLGPYIRQILSGSRWAESFAGHMIMFACRRKP